MAKFQNVYTEISQVNGGDQFGNEPLSADAINVALQNTQALKDGGATVANAENATNAQNATNAAHSNQAAAADCLLGENTQIKLGNFSATGRPITETQLTLGNTDKIRYLGKWYNIILFSGELYVQCNSSDPIAQVATGTAFSVAKSVAPKDLWVFDGKWTEVAAGGTYAVTTGDTYQILVQADEIVQAIILIVGNGTYLLGATGAVNSVNSDSSTLLRYYQAEVQQGKLKVTKARITSFNNIVTSASSIAFRIRKIG